MKFTEQDYKYIDMALEVAKRSTCVRHGRKIGAVFVKDGKVLYLSCNGVLANGCKSCEELGGCIRNRLNVITGTQNELCYATCAETRCVCEAARDGIAIKGAVVYCTHRPCVICTRVMATAEVARVIYKEDYPDPNAAAIAKAVGLPVFQLQ